MHRRDPIQRSKSILNLQTKVEGADLLALPFGSALDFPPDRSSWSKLRVRRDRRMLMIMTRNEVELAHKAGHEIFVVSVFRSAVTGTVAAIDESG
ncbi:MAG: hypothetical protein K1X67_10345 [Fimbriimonadaceae bacterium]|nr:hypothetical protein [Fimbriimonadaceae bacterium]